MSSIDNRIVKLIFDNSQFERNAQTSIDTLSKLKTSLTLDDAVANLNDATKSLNSVNFESIGSTLESLNDKFSAFGVIGRTVLTNLTTAAMDFGAKMAANVIDPIVSGGSRRALALENAKFTLQGLVNDAEEVDNIMKDAKNSVSGTAFALNDAANAAAQFTASGLRSGEEMQSVLAAIAGTAATVNADYGDISHIFTTVAGNGRLMTEQLNQLSYRGMNAAATLTNAFNDVLHGSSKLSGEMQEHIRMLVQHGIDNVKDFTGTLEGMTEGDLRKLVSSGVVDFNTFSAVMALTFGDHAKDANHTFTGSMANIQAALARTGAMFYTDLIAQEGPLVRLFNSVINAVDEFNKHLTPLVQIWNEFVISFAEGAKVMLDTFIEKGGFSVIGDIFWEIGHIIRQVARIIHEAAAGIGDVLDPLTDLRDEFFSSAEFKGSGWADVLLDVVGKIRDFLHDLANNLEFWNAFYKIARSIVNVFAGLKNIIGIVFDVLSAIFGALKEVGSSSGALDIILGLTEGFRKFTEVIRPTAEQLEQLKNFFKGVFETVKLVVGIVTGALKKAFEVVGSLLGATNTDGNIFYGLLSKIGDLLQMIAGTVQNFISSVKIAAGVVKEFADEIGITDKLKEFLSFFDVRARLEDFKNVLSAVKDKILEFADAINVGDALREFVENVKNFVASFTSLHAADGSAEMLDEFKEKLVSAKDSLVEFLNVVGENFSPYFDKFKDQVKGAIESVKQFIEMLKDGGAVDIKDTIVGKLKSAFEKIKEVIDAILPNIKEKIESVKNAIKDFVSSLKNVGDGEGLSLLDIIGAGGVIIAIKTVIDKLKDAFGGGDKETGSLIEQIKELKDAVCDTLGSIQDTLKASTLIGIAIAIGILAASLYAIASIDTEKVLGALFTVSMLSLILEKFLEALTELDLSSGDLIKAATTMIGVSAAVYLLAKAMEKIGTLDPEQLYRGLLVVSVLLIEVGAITAILGELGGTMMKGMSGLVLMAGAIALLSVPIKQIGEMDPAQMEQGMQAVTVLIAMMALLVGAAKGSNFGASAGAGLILMAVSLKVVLLAVKDVIEMAGQYDNGVLTQAMATVELIIASMAGIMVAAKGTNFGASAGAGLILMAASIQVVLMAVKEVVSMAETMDPDTLNQAMLGVAAIMGLMIGLMAASKGSSFGASAGVGLLLLAVAINLLVQPLEQLGKLSLFELATALIAIAGALFIMITAVQLLGADDMDGVLALTVLAAALVVLAFGLSLISAIPFPVLLGSLLGLAIAIGGFAVAASLLTPVLGPMMILSGILLAMGVAMLAAAAAIAVFVATAPLIAGALLAFLESITTMADPICKAIIDFINEMADVIRNNHDAFYDAMGNLLSAIWEALSDLVGRIASFIAENLPGWIETAQNTAKSMIDGFVEWVLSGINNVIEAGKSFARGFLDGICSIPGEIASAASDFGSQALGAVQDFLGIHSPSRVMYEVGQYFAQGFVNGVSDSSRHAAEETEAMAMAVMSAFDNAVDGDYEPTITPVLDTANIQNGIGEMTSMFDTLPSTYDINGVIDANKQMSIAAMEGMGSPSDYSTILSEMAGLREDMSTYNDLLSKLQIVMDTGTLVGSLSPGIDRQLGRNAILAGRGVV